MILQLHSCTSISGGPSWLLPHLPGGTHEGGWTSAGQAGVTWKGSAPCLSLGFTRKGLGSGPVNCLSCSCWSAAHCSPTPLLGGGHHTARVCAHSQTARLAPGLQAPGVCPPAHRVRSWGCLPGVSQTGSYLDNRMQRCPCAKVLGVDGWLTCFHPRDLSQSEKPCARTLEWWQAQLPLAPT